MFNGLLTVENYSKKDRRLSRINIQLCLSFTFSHPRTCVCNATVGGRAGAGGDSILSPQEGRFGLGKGGGTLLKGTSRVRRRSRVVRTTAQATPIIPETTSSSTTSTSTTYWTSTTSISSATQENSTGIDYFMCIVTLVD